jgi:hypothetical protein
MHHDLNDTAFAVITRMESPNRQNIVRAGTARMHLATIKRSCRGALPILSMGALLVGLVALRTAIYFSRFHY